MKISMTSPGFHNVKTAHFSTHWNPTRTHRWINLFVEDAEGSKQEVLTLFLDSTEGVFKIPEAIGGKVDHGGGGFRVEE